jgi:hypothetical protein
MALLAYLVMVAFLMTSAFVGLEWIATSSEQRISAHHLLPAKSAVIIDKRNRYLAAQSKPERDAYSDAAPHSAVAAASHEESATASAQTTQSEDAPAHNRTRTASSHRSRTKMAYRRPRNEVTQAELGYGGFASEPNSFSGGWR